MVADVIADHVDCESSASTSDLNLGHFVAWGKLSRDTSGQMIGVHPLLDHMTDVAACFLALAECVSVRRSMECTARRDLDTADLQRLAVLVFLHDIGKANSGFQSRRWKSPERPPGYWPTSPFGHGPEGWELIAGRLFLQRSRCLALV